MGLSCSLLGHAFDETDTERERSEQGSEVVTVVRELEVCSRCGETRVVSENKEVTTIVEPDDDGPAGFSAGPTADDAESTDEPADDAAGRLDDEPDPAEEDAEILDAAEEEPDRAPGEWPEEEHGTAATAASAVDLTETPEPSPAAGGVPDGDFVCPACGFSEPVEGSSLRAGDACPECQRGYLDAE